MVMTSRPSLYHSLDTEFMQRKRQRHVNMGTICLSYVRTEVGDSQGHEERKNAQEGDPSEAGELKIAHPQLPSSNDENEDGWYKRHPPRVFADTLVRKK